MKTKNINNLTEREFEIMVKVSGGKLNKEIAEDLACRLNTVRKHLQHIYPKLNVQNRTEASLKFLKLTGKIKSKIIKT